MTLRFTGLIFGFSKVDSSSFKVYIYIFGFRRCFVVELDYFFIFEVETSMNHLFEALKCHGSMTSGDQRRSVVGTLNEYECCNFMNGVLTEEQKLTELQ